MATSLHRPLGDDPAVNWSLFAGLYVFGWATVTALALDQVLTLLASVVGLPGRYSAIVFPAPALLVGAVTWWALVERRGGYSYPLGAAFGLLTALLTGLLWTAWFVTVWGVEMLVIREVAIIAAFVIGFGVVVGGISGISLMYARRQRTTGPLETG